MANFPCSAGDGESAAYLLTDLVDDVTINLCQPHMAAWSSAFLEAWAEANVPDPTPEIMPEPQVIVESAADDSAGPSTVKRRRPPRPTGNQS